MRNKNIQFGDDGRGKLLSGIRKMAGAVKSTLGPMGNTVLIESPRAKVTQGESQ